MAGIPVVVVSSGGVPVTPVQSGAPVLTVSQSGHGLPVTPSNNAAPFIIDGDFAPVNMSLPFITGIPEEGETLTGSTGTWAAAPSPSYARSWYRDGVQIPAESGNTYTLTSDDVGKEITFRVTATNSVGSAHAESASVLIES
jgi:hypothetical protein